MIFRIMGEGQYDVPDTALDRLNELDDGVERAVASGSEPDLAEALGALHARVRALGHVLADDSLLPSDVVLPPEGAEIADVQHLFEGDGLVPGR